MKNTNVVSAIVGASFFAIPFLLIPTAPIWASVAIGATAFGASELMFSDSRKIAKLKEKNKPLYQKIEKANRDYSYIYSMINKVEDKNVQNDLSEICKTIEKIISVVAREPEREKSIANFFDYYLPVLVKIVSRYDEIENQKLESSDSKKFMKSAAKMISEVNKSFQKILSSLYQEDIVDADAEMKVFNSMLKADGLDDSGINVEKEDKDE